MNAHINKIYCNVAENHIKYNKLAAIQDFFKKTHNLTPVIGAELEFYLSESTNIELLSNDIGYKIKPEKGKNQFEIDFSHTSNLCNLTQTIESTRNNIIDSAKKLCTSASFHPKPFKDDYGSSMHIHLNFLEDNEIEKYIQILCNYLDRYIDSCLPTKEDYKRLDHRFMTPTHICWGGNNRTVLIRIPDSKPIRLEHRLPSANSDPALVVFSILNAINEGLLTSQKNLLSFPKIYGNAFDPQYKLQRITKKL